MSWFNVDDRVHAHPKTRQSPFAALGLWTAAGAYAANFNTDGRIPAWFPASQRRHPDEDVDALIAALVALGLWEPCEQGWQMHDYQDWNRTHAQILETQEKERARKAAARARLLREREAQQKKVRTQKK